MTNAFGLPDDFDDEYDYEYLGALLAAGFSDNRWTTGGNSDFNRRANVAMQQRDKKGQWVWQGGRGFWKGLLNGVLTNFVGRYLRADPNDPNYMIFLVDDDNEEGIPGGLYRVNRRAVTMAKALLSEENLEEAGVDVNGNRLGETLDRDIEDITANYLGPATPEDLALLDDPDNAEENVVREANRAAANAKRPYKSYNVVDEAGNRVDTDAEHEDPFPGEVNENNRFTPEQLEWAKRNFQDYFPAQGLFPDASDAEVKQAVNSLRGIVARAESGVSTEEDAPVLERIGLDHLKYRLDLAEGELYARGKMSKAETKNFLEDKFRRALNFPARKIGRGRAAERDAKAGNEILNAKAQAALMPSASEVQSAIASKDRAKLEDINKRFTQIQRSQDARPGGTIAPIDFALWDRVKKALEPSVADKYGVRRVSDMLDEARAGSEEYRQKLENGEDVLPKGVDQGADAENKFDPSGVINYEENFIEWAGPKINSDISKISSVIAEILDSPEDDERRTELPQLQELLQNLVDDKVRYTEPAPRIEDGVRVADFPEFQLDTEFINDSPAFTANQKDSLRTLASYMSKTLQALTRSAVSGDQQKYDFQYAIASQIKDALEKAKAFSENPNDSGFFLFSGSESARFENMRFIQSSIKMAPSNDPKLKGQQIVKSATAIAVSKTGRPFIVKYEDSSVIAFPLEGGHSLGYISNVSVPSGADGHANSNERDKPTPASVGMIRVSDGLQNEGIAGFMVNMARWACVQSGRPFEHSYHLLTPGNMYSKLVSMRIEYHARDQREKFVFERYGGTDNPLFKALDGLGWLTTSFKKKLNRGTQKSFDNQGMLDEEFVKRLFGSLNGTDVGVAGDLRDTFHNDPNAKPGVDYPAIMEDHIKGENEDWSKFDIQDMILRSIFRGQMNKEELIGRLKEIETQFSDFYSRNKDSEVQKVKRSALRCSLMAERLRVLIPALEAADDFTGKYDEHPEFDTFNAQFFQSPFPGEDSKFVNFKIPSGATKVDVRPTFSPRAIAPQGAPANWTENPATLANLFGYEELALALDVAVRGGNEEAVLKFNGVDGSVNVAAVYRAISEQGRRADQALATIYDNIAGNDDNKNALAEHDAKLRGINEEIQGVVDQLSIGMRGPTAFDEIGGVYAPRGQIIFAGQYVRRDIPDNSEVDPRERLSPLLERNTGVVFAGSDIVSLAPTPHRTQLGPDSWLERGVTDSPRIIARNFSPRALEDAFRAFLSSGGAVRPKLRFANNAQLDVPASVIRDALQHQGVDTEAIINDPQYAGIIVVAKRQLQPIANNEIAERDGTQYRYSLQEIEGTDVRLGFLENRDAQAAGDKVIIIETGNGSGERFVQAEIEIVGEGVVRLKYNRPHELRPSGGFTYEEEFASVADASLALTFALMRDYNLLNNRLPALARYASNGDLAEGAKEFRNVVVDEGIAEKLPEGIVRRTSHRNSGVLDNLAVYIDETADGSIHAYATRVDETGKLHRERIGVFERSVDEQGKESFTLSTNIPGHGIGNGFSASSRDYANDVIKFLASKHVGSRTVIGSEELVETAKNRLLFNSEIKEISNLTSTKDRATGVTTSEADIIIGNGRRARLRVTHNSTKPPRYTYGDQYKYATLEITDEGGNSIFSGQIVRSGRSTWVARISAAGQGYREYTLNFSVAPAAERDKALDQFKKALIEKFGISADKVQQMIPGGTPVEGGTVIPEGRISTPILNPDELRQPEIVPVGSMERAENIANRIEEQKARLEVNALAESTAFLKEGAFKRLATLVESLGGKLSKFGRGASGPFKFTDRFGRVFKIKNYARDFRTELRDGEIADPDGQSRIVRNEVAAHALADLMGVRASAGGIGITPGNGANSPTPREVIAELVEPNIVTGEQGIAINDQGEPVSGNELTWYNMPADDPRFDRARQDVVEIRALGLLTGASDIRDDNIVLTRDSDGNYRATIVDLGSALAISGYPNRIQQNEKFNDPVEAYISHVLGGEGVVQAIRDGQLDTPLVANGNYAKPATVGDLKQALGERVVPLSPNAIRRLFASVFSNEEDKKNATDRLISRRAEILEMFGLEDPHRDEVPAGSDGNRVGGTGDGSGSSTTPSSDTSDTSGTSGTTRVTVDANGIPVLEYLDQNGKAPRRIVRRSFRDSKGNQQVIDIVERESGVIEYRRPTAAGSMIGSIVKNSETGDRLLTYNGIRALFRPEIGNPEGDARALKNAMDMASIQAYFQSDEAFSWNDQSPVDVPRWLAFADGMPSTLSLGGGVKGYLNRLNSVEGFEDTPVEMYGRELSVSSILTNTADRIYSAILGHDIPEADKAYFMGVASTAGRGLTIQQVVDISAEISRRYPRVGASTSTSSTDGSSSETTTKKSDNETPDSPQGEVAKNVANLRVGDYIVGIGRVVYVVDDGGNFINVGVIDDAGEFLNISYARNVMLFINNQADQRRNVTNIAGGRNAVDNFAQEGNRTLDEVKRQYPNHRVLPNGDLLLATEDATERSRERRTFRHEVIVHRTGAEEFVSYIRRYQIDPRTGQRIGDVTEAAYLTEPAHSAQALTNRIPRNMRVLRGEEGALIAKFPQQGDFQVEVRDPRTGMRVPPRLLPIRNEEFIGDTGIAKTGNPVKDAVIGYISDMIDRGYLNSTVLSRMRDNGILNEQQVMDVIERVEARRRAPINAIPYVGRDRQTIVRVGDEVDHYDAHGNFLKKGKVVGRVPLQVYVKRQGVYEYEDIVTVRWEDGTQYNISSRRLQTTKRANGEAPVPLGGEILNPFIEQEGPELDNIMDPDFEPPVPPRNRVQPLPLPNGYETRGADQASSYSFVGTEDPSGPIAQVQKTPDGKWKATFQRSQGAPVETKVYADELKARNWAINQINAARSTGTEVPSGGDGPPPGGGGGGNGAGGAGGDGSGSGSTSDDTSNPLDSQWIEEEDIAPDLSDENAPGFRFGIIKRPDGKGNQIEYGQDPRDPGNNVVIITDNNGEELDRVEGYDTLDDARRDAVKIANAFPTDYEEVDDGAGVIRILKIDDVGEHHYALRDRNNIRFFDQNGELVRTELVPVVENILEARQIVKRVLDELNGVGAGDGENEAIREAREALRAEGITLGEGLPQIQGPEQLKEEIVANGKMVRIGGKHNGVEVAAYYAVAPADNGEFEFKVFSNGEVVGQGFEPDIPGARDRALEQLQGVIERLDAAGGNGGNGIAEQLRQLPMGYSHSTFGDLDVVHGDDPRQPAVVWDKANGDLYFFKTYQRYLERGFEGADEAEMDARNENYVGSEIVRYVNGNQQANLPAMQFNDAFKRQLNFREIANRLPEGYQHEVRGLNGFDSPVAIFFNPNDPNAKAVVLSGGNGEVRVYGSYQAILNEDGARSIYEGLVDPMRAQVKVIELIDRDALYRGNAPVDSIDNREFSNDEIVARLPEGYRHRTMANKLVFMGNDPDQPAVIFDDVGQLHFFKKWRDYLDNDLRGAERKTEGNFRGPATQKAIIDYINDNQPGAGGANDALQQDFDRVLSLLPDGYKQANGTYLRDNFGVALFVDPSNPNRPAVRWKAREDIVEYWGNYQTLLDGNPPDIDERDLTNPDDAVNKIVDYIKSNDPQNAPLGNAGVVAQLPAGYRTIQYLGNDAFRKGDGDRYAWITPNNRVQYWDTRAARVRGDDPAFEQTFANRAEAEQAVIRLINTGQFVTAPVERVLPEGYARTEGLRGQFIEIGMPEDAPDAANKPYGFVQKMGNMWQEKYYNTLQSYLDGNEPDAQNEYADKDEALNNLIDKINAQIEATRGRRPGELPEGYVVEGVASGENSFEVKNENDPDNKPYALIEKNEDGKWVALKWATGQAAADARYRRPQAQASFDTREEAQAWAADQMADPMAEFAGMEILDVDQKIIESYGGNLSPRMIESLRLRQAFLAGYEVIGRPRRGGSHGTVKVRLSNGQVAYLKSAGEGRDRGMGSTRDNVIRELVGGRMFEAIGGNLRDEVVIAHVFDPEQGREGVLFREIENEGHGGDMRGDATRADNAREMALMDFLTYNTDRHGGNWVFRNGNVFPIDHGLILNGRDRRDPENPNGVNTTLEKLRQRDSWFNQGIFTPMIYDWERGRRPGLFSADEMEQIAARVRGLEQMYESMGLGRIFREDIIPRLDVLLGIARNQ